MLEFMRASMVALLALASAAGCKCDRGNTLAGRNAELVIVQQDKTGAELLGREVQLTVPPAVMGETTSGTFLVRNIGDARLTLTKISLADGSTAFTVELPEVTVLEPAEETTFAITFTPEQATDATLISVLHQATFLLDSSGGREGERTASLEVRAEAIARDCYVPARIDFGESPIGQTVWMPLSLSNTGPTAAQATLGMVGGPNPAFFTLDPPGPTVDVAPQTPSEVQVRFTPATDAQVEARLTVRRRASCPEATTTLVGRGSMQSISWLPTEINFGRVPLRDTATRTVTLTNRSGATIPLTLTAEGTDFLVPTATATLAARTTTQVQISCSPSSLTSLTGTFRIDVGTNPTLPIRVGLRCSGGGPRLRVTPSPLAFGTVPFEVDAQNRPVPPARQPETRRRLRLENVGTPPSPPGDPSFNLLLGRDGNPPLMSLTPLGATTASEVQVGLVQYPDGGVPALAGRNTIDAEVRIRPESAGLKDALLTIYSTDAVQPVQTVRITANAVSARACSVAHLPAALSFGDVPPDHTSKLTLTLTNSSDDSCLVSGLEIAPGSHAGFVMSSTTPSSTMLGPRQSLPIQVEFNSNGLLVGTTASGFLRYSRPGSATPLLVPLGARVAECLVAVPEEVDFGNIKLSCRSAPRTVQVFNTCGIPLTLTSAAIAGSPFAISSSPAGGASVRIQPSQSATYGVVFGTLQSVGTFLGTLRFTSDSSTLPIEVPLRGVGDMTGTTTETWTQPAQPVTDILFTVDNSCSMADKQQGLALNFGSFISYAQTANIDYRIAITTTDDFAANAHGAFVQSPPQPTVLARSTPMVAQLFASRVNVGTVGSGNEMPLSCTLKALSEPLISGQNAGFLRDDANLAIIVVSDAPDQSLEPVDYYLTRLPLVKGVRRMHQVSVSVIGPFQQPGSGCTIEDLDTGVYQSLITKTGGVRANICTTNWAQELEALGRSALGPRSTFFVRNPPDTGQPIDVSINGQPVSNAWRYDPVTNTIVFQNGQAPGAGTTLTVTYQSQCL